MFMLVSILLVPLLGLQYLTCRVNTLLGILSKYLMESSQHCAYFTHVTNLLKNGKEGWVQKLLLIYAAWKMYHLRDILFSLMQQEPSSHQEKYPLTCSHLLLFPLRSGSMWQGNLEIILLLQKESPLLEISVGDLSCQIQMIWPTPSLYTLHMFGINPGLYGYRKKGMFTPGT